MLGGGSGYNGFWYFSPVRDESILLTVWITVWPFHGVHAVLGSLRGVPFTYVATLRARDASSVAFEALDESTVQ
jgi:hypothetical protein